MAITKFIPQIWSASLLTALRDRLTYGQTGIINRNYEGDIARAGDSVHITSFADPAVRTYTKNGTIDWDLLTDTQQTLVVDQSDYFAFKVDDIDKRQALPGFIAETTKGASYNLAAKTDAFLSGLMAAGAQKTFTDVELASPRDAYDLLVKFRTVLTRTNTPDDGRWVVVPPEVYALLLEDARFVEADKAGTTEALRNGFVGRAAGFDIIESNVVPFEGTAWKLIAGHGMATTYAQQIASVEGVRLQDTFGDGVKGLHLYGAKVIRPKQLVVSETTLITKAGAFDPGTGVEISEWPFDGTAWAKWNLADLRAAGEVLGIDDTKPPMRKAGWKEAIETLADVEGDAIAGTDSVKRLLAYAAVTGVAITEEQAKTAAGVFAVLDA